MKLTAKEKEAALKMIEQEGDCSGVMCSDCPLDRRKTGKRHRVTVGVSEGASKEAYMKAKLQWLKDAVSGAMWEQEDL